MKKLYHGTTIEAKEEIIQGRYDPESTIWSCSNPGFMYVYGKDELCEAEGWDEDCTTQEQEDNCARRANESAQIANAILPKPGNKTCVIEFQILDELYEKAKEDSEISPDDSCENMGSCGSLQVDVCWLNEHIKTGEIKMRVWVFEFNPCLTPFYLSSLFQNEYFEETLEKLSPLMYDAVKVIAEAGILLEDLFDCECLRIENIKLKGD